jgi:hypothetical protein
MPNWVRVVDCGKVFTASLNESKQLSSKPPTTGSPKTIGAWRVRVDDIFDISYGTSLELNRLTPDASGVNFVARTARNNGISERVALPADVEPIPGECLSVAVSGSVLETFYQKEPFVTGFHVMVLRPKKPTRSPPPAGARF